MDESHTPGRNELGELCDEIRGAPQACVLLEVGVKGGVIQDLSAGPVVGELLQRQGSSGNVLRQGLSGMVVVAVEAYGIVHGESRVPPAQEGSGELLADEAPLQEKCDGSSAQAFAQTRGVMDGEVVELAAGIEPALEYEGMEMRMKAERVTEGLIGEGRSGGDGLGGRC
jgi:hypothetical protein